MLKRIKAITILGALFALSVISLHQFANRPISFIEQLSRVRYDDTVTTLPIPEVSGIKVISQNINDEPQALTEEESEHIKRLLEIVELDGTGYLNEADNDVPNANPNVPDGGYGEMFLIALNSSEEFSIRVSYPNYIIRSGDTERWYITNQLGLSSNIESLYLELAEKYFPGRILWYHNSVS